jgi:predicted metal-dependent hydrolase
VSLDWKHGALAEGLACYYKAEFFLAHEHWECVWLKLAEPEKSFLQALIQMTAAFHHLQDGNRAGATSLLRRALRRLELSSASFGGIEVWRLIQEVREWLPALESSATSFPPIFPRICLIDLPTTQP